MHTIDTIAFMVGKKPKEDVFNNLKEANNYAN